MASQTNNVITLTSEARPQILQSGLRVGSTSIADLTPASVGPRSGLGEEPAEIEHATILIVDAVDINRQLMRAWLKGADYRILEVRKASQAWEVLSREDVHLIIVDLMLPEVSGLDFCRMLKSKRSTQLIPVLILTSVQGVDNEIAGMESGADEFLIKPLQPPVVRARVRAMLRAKAAVDTLDEAETILFALAQAVEHRDRYTHGHCERLAHYSISMGMTLGLSRNDLIALYRGGYLHDIGKICVPDGILFKQGPLTPEEWEVMRAHPMTGEQICRPMKSLRPVLPIIRSHHERWNGTGYPDGLRGEDIPLLARILQAADIYDALTTARPYKPAHSRQDAIAIMSQETAHGWRDPKIMDLVETIHLDVQGNESEQLSEQLRMLNRNLNS